MTAFEDISYLQEGTCFQKRVFGILKKYAVFEILADYSPLLAGTIPIGIDIKGSDLDIICQVKDDEAFELLLLNRFGRYPDFSLTAVSENLRLCNFTLEDIPVEIYAARENPFQGRAYRHMLLENRLLNILGQEFRARILRLKQQGYKTEPAFALLLGLNGDPFEALLALENVSDETLTMMYKNKASLY